MFSRSKNITFFTIFFTTFKQFENVQPFLLKSAYFFIVTFISWYCYRAFKRALLHICLEQIEPPESFLSVAAQSKQAAGKADILISVGE